MWWGSSLGSLLVSYLPNFEGFLCVISQLLGDGPPWGQSCVLGSLAHYGLWSLQDKKIENVLGHYQKDFMGGLSAEILGKFSQHKSGISQSSEFQLMFIEI